MRGARHCLACSLGNASGPGLSAGTWTLGQQVSGGSFRDEGALGTKLSTVDMALPGASGHPLAHWFGLCSTLPGCPCGQ